MKKIMYLISLIIFPLVVKSQGYHDKIQNQLEEYDIQEKLPALNQLLEMAEANSPLLKMIDAEIVIQDIRIRAERKDWLSYFSVDGGVKYGAFDNLILSQDLGIDELSNSNTKQTRYSLGFAVKVPISVLFDETEKNIAINEGEKLLHQRENTIKELRKLVIVQYGNILKAHATLIIRSSEFESTKALFLEKELNYKKGKLELSDYTKTKSTLLNAQLSLEQIKIEFITAVNILQETVGVKLNLIESN